MSKDGVERLCTVLYGRTKAGKYLGDNDAPMLHDAADTIIQLRAAMKAAARKSTNGEVSMILVDMLQQTNLEKKDG